MLESLSSFLIRRRWFVIAALLVVQVSLLVDLAARIDWTADERTWLLVGRTIFSGADWQVTEQRLQGPLGLWANQLFVAGAFDPVQPEPHLFPARLGMLVFPIVLLLLAERFARQAYGAGAGLLAAFLIAFSPTILGNGALLANDVALATTTVLVAWLTWRFLLDPRWWRSAALGAGLGLLLATKYSSLLLAASVPVVVVLAWLAGFDPRSRHDAPMPARRSTSRLLSGIARIGAHLLLAGVVAIVVLHATYLFRAGTFGVERIAELRSGAFRAVAAIPGGAWLLAVLPEPLVAGADYQATVSRGFGGRFLDVHGGHPAYYPVSLATKTALPILLLFVASHLWRPRRRVRFAGLCLGVPAILLFGYLTLLSSLQGGVRYLMPVLALLVIRAAAFASSRAVERTAGRVALALACAWLAIGTLRTHPYELGYFHELVGGPAGGWRLFADINCDWRQEYHHGRQVLSARHPDVQFLGPADGPRFGRLAAYCLDLKPPDPEHEGRTWHWLARFQPVDHHSAAWLVFDVAPEDFVNAARAGDARAARDLAFAWLHAGDRAAAREALSLPGEGREAVAAILDLLDRLDRGAGDETVVARALIDGLTRLGRPDLAARYLDRIDGESTAELVLMLSRAGRDEEAVELLRRAARNGPLSAAEAMLLAFAEFRSARPREALAVLDASERPEAGSPLEARWLELRARLEQAVRSADALEGR